MKRVNFALILLLITSSAIFAQTRPSRPNDGKDLAPGFKIRPNGVIDMADLFFEVNYYDSKWVIAQQHDRFTPASDAEQTPSGATVAGTLTTAGGPASYAERVEKVDGGINYSATFLSEKELATNELSITFLLPTPNFAGKEIRIDDQPLTLAMEAAAKGASRLMEKDGVHTVTLPTREGTLTITGNFHFLLGDDREWGDPRYSMRLYFTPGSGSIKESKIDLQLRLAK